MLPVQLIGIELLEETEKSTVNNLVEEYVPKIVRELKNDTSVTVHLKAHTKGGKRKKFDVRIKVSSPTKIIEAQESDWDLAKTLHKVFSNVQRELQHKLHADNQHYKSYG